VAEPHGQDWSGVLPGDWSGVVAGARLGGPPFNRWPLPSSWIGPPIGQSDGASGSLDGWGVVRGGPGLVVGVAQAWWWGWPAWLAWGAQAPPPSPPPLGDGLELAGSRGLTARGVELVRGVTCRAVCGGGKGSASMPVCSFQLLHCCLFVGGGLV